MCSLHLQTSQIRLAAFQLLISHMQLVATMLNSAESIQEGEFIEHAFKYLCNVKLLWKFLNTYLQFFTYAIMD